MSTTSEAREPALRRLAYAVLAKAVRGRRERGGEWGEAVLAEFGETRGGWQAVRWAAGGLRTVWQERRQRVRQLPRYDRLARRIAVVSVVTAVACGAFNQYVLGFGFVATGSMEPTLQPADRYLLDKAGYRFTGLHHGDVVKVTVVLEPGAEPSKHIKRVIGLPGDTIECRDGRVWRDGSPLDEPYLPLDPGDARTDCSPVTVPPGQLYLLGDHRIVSMDSRQFGTVREGAVEARMVTRVWPIRD